MDMVHLKVGGCRDLCCATCVTGVTRGFSDGLRRDDLCEEVLGGVDAVKLVCELGLEDADDLVAFDVCGGAGCVVARVLSDFEEVHGV